MTSEAQAHRRRPSAGCLTGLLVALVVLVLAFGSRILGFGHSDARTPEW